MITREWMVIMARYNSWQNGSQFQAAGRLSDAQRREDLGAFFKSIQGTLNHILWADQMWLSRFGICPPAGVTSLAESSNLHDSWDELAAERLRFDSVISHWAGTFDPASAAGELTWFSGAVGRDVTRSRTLILTHIFNHQTHHRGQVHAMLTRLGINPGNTDLPLQPD